MLELKNIKKSFAGKPILKGIDLSFNDGEFVVLVGPSGCGKTTLIRIIAGLEDLDSGSILYNKKEIQHLAPKDRKLAMVFQNYALYPHKTVFENIAFPLKIANQAKDLIKTKVENIAEKLELTSYLSRKPRELSGGQRQRVALARAMAKEPEIFLLDEPLSNLDAKLRMQMRHEIFKLRSTNKASFVYVTHDQVEALSLGDRIVVMKDGEIEQIGSPEEIYSKPASPFVASFIGSPGANLLRLKKFPNLVAIRPEFLALNPQNPNAQKLEVKVQNIEMLGQEYLIYGLVEEQLVIAKLNSIENFERINKIKNELDQNNSLTLYYSANLLYQFS